MPMFEYRCRACGEKTERLQSAPAEEIECPACRQPAKRVVSVTSGSCGCSAPAGSGFS